MTTDTYPKVATAHRRDRRRRRDDQRHRQGRRHDRAGHGDDAVLRRHRRADRGAGAAGAAVGRHGRPSTPSPSTAIPRPPTRCCCLPPARPPSAGQPRIDDPADPRACRLRRGAERGAARPGAAGRARRRGRAQDGRGHREGAEAARSAKRIALSIANSPLVKTAIAGEDANWGRVVMAVGKAGEPADRDRLAIWFGDIRVAHRGRARPGLFRSRDLGLHEGRGHRASASSSASAAARRRSGPAT